jgi:hypothetical protein
VRSETGSERYNPFFAVGRFGDAFSDCLLDIDPRLGIPTFVEIDDQAQSALCPLKPPAGSHATVQELSSRGSFLAVTDVTPICVARHRTQGQMKVLGYETRRFGKNDLGDLSSNAISDACTRSSGGGCFEWFSPPLRTRARKRY